MSNRDISTNTTIKQIADELNNMKFYEKNPSIYSEEELDQIEKTIDQKYSNQKNIKSNNTNNAVATKILMETFNSSDSKYSTNNKTISNQEKTKKDNNPKCYNPFANNDADRYY